MDDLSSDGEFVETNFIEPSPVKKRNNLLPDPKKRKEILKEREIARAKLKKIDEDFLLYLSNITRGSSLPAAKVLSSTESTDEIYFLPRSRLYFTEQTGTVNPAKWFSKGSFFHDYSLEEFILYVNHGFLLPKSQNVDEENIQIKSFCLNLLSDNIDYLTANYLLQFLSKCFIPYDLILLKERGTSHLDRLLQVIKESIPRYTAVEAQELFREVILASLDPRCVTVFSFPSFLTSCLQVSSVEFPIKDEIDWIIDQQLEPEEFSHLLDVLPQSGCFKDVGLLFAAKALASITENFQSIVENFTLASLVAFIKQKEPVIRHLSFNNLYHFLNILHYIFLRIPSFEDHESIKEICSFLKGIQRRHQLMKNVSFSTVNVAISRLNIIVSHHLRQ